MKILFFASLRETLQCDELILATTPMPCNVVELKANLSEKSAQWRKAFADERLLVAVNQTMVKDNIELSVDDEVAFFPPVTGG